jgi:hypothetical protein
MFAKWWDLEMQPHHRPHPRNSDCTYIEAAIHARWIMNNDLSHIESVEEKRHIPYLIWYPHVADGVTYEELARRRRRARAWLPGTRMNIDGST